MPVRSVSSAAGRFYTIQTNTFTVATLPAGVTGRRAIVTDALTPTILTAVTGGGAVVVPVFYNGTSWVVG